jgi:hypothetical protein
MNRNPLNQGTLNAFSFTAILVVMGIVLFLSVHPYNCASSASILVSRVIVCMLGS